MGRTANKKNDEIFDKIQTYNKSASPSTIRIYTLNIIKLFKDLGKEETSSALVFKDVDKVFELLDKQGLTKTTYKNKLSSIVVFLLASGMDKTTINKYSDKIDSLASKIDREANKMKWAEKDEDNVLSMDALNLYVDTLETKLPSKPESYKDLNQWMSYISAKYHSEFAPRNELCDMKIYYTNEYSSIDKDDSINYIIINPKTLNAKVIYNNFKTKKSYGAIEFDIDDKDFISIVNKYYKYIKSYYAEHDEPFTHWLLFKKDMKKLSRNEYTKFLIKTFEGTGKNISSSLLRKIVASSLYDINKIKHMAAIMGHSIREAIHSYVKE
jgi:hypothetical protein